MLLDITGAHFERSEPVAGADRTVYDTCLAYVAGAHGREELESNEIRLLREAPTILNLEGVPTLPDEILLHDSEWFAKFFGRDLDRALCRLSAELYPLAMELGVRRLSECASVSRDFVDGEKQDETTLAEMLRERTEIVARLLHDELVEVRDRVRDALSAIGAVSYDVVHIKASVQLDTNAVPASPTPADAFYDVEEGQLTIRRPVTNRSWAHILNAVLHQLMPGATGSEISKLTLQVRLLMEMTVEDAHRELTDAGVPPLVDAPPAADPADLTSQELGELGAVTKEKTADR